MSKQTGWFLSISALLIGSFFGNYLRIHGDGMRNSPQVTATALLDSANGDQKKLAEASDLLREETSRNPENFSALFLQGRVQQQRGLVDMALQSYEEYFRKKESADFAANFNAAELYELKGDFANAEKYFMSAISVAPNESGSWERLILMLIKQNRTADAKEYYQSLKEILPQSDAVKRLSTIVPQ